MKPTLIALLLVAVKAASLRGGNNPLPSTLMLSEVETDLESFERKPLDVSDFELQDDLEWVRQESNKENKANVRFPVIGSVKRGIKGFLKRDQIELTSDSQPVDFPQLGEVRPTGDSFKPRKSASNRLNEAKAADFERLNAEMQQYLRSELRFGIPREKKGVFSWLYHLAQVGRLKEAVSDKSTSLIRKFLSSNMAKHLAKYHEIREQFENDQHANQVSLEKFEKMKRRWRPDAAELNYLKADYETGIQNVKELAEQAREEAKMYVSYKFIQDELNKILAN